ncbi:hypothetical protein AAMO2058_001502300 [Amorphochlora amoebiformis]
MAEIFGCRSRDAFDGDVIPGFRSVLIIRNELVDGHTEYVVWTRAFGKSAIVRRRFRDFLTLWKNLKKLHSPMPSLPSKNILFWRNLDKQFVSKRQERLERALRDVTRCPQAAQTKLFADFLGIPAQSDWGCASNVSQQLGSARRLGDKPTTLHP